MSRGGKAGRKWHADETYIRVHGVWYYLYRAIDADGQLVDSMLSEQRDMDAARRFLARSLEVVGHAPEKVTTDGHDAYPRAIREILGEGVIHRCSQYMNKGNHLAPVRCTGRDGHFVLPNLTQPTRLHQNPVPR